MTGSRGLILSPSLTVVALRLGARVPDAEVDLELVALDHAEERQHDPGHEEEDYKVPDSVSHVMRVNS